MIGKCYLRGNMDRCFPRSKGGTSNESSNRNEVLVDDSRFSTDRDSGNLDSWNPPFSLIGFRAQTQQRICVCWYNNNNNNNEPFLFARHNFHLPLWQASISPTKHVSWSSPTNQHGCIGRSFGRIQTHHVVKFLCGADGNSTCTKFHDRISKCTHLELTCCVSW